MSSESYHEPIEALSEETRDLHRAIQSLIEELEAIDWYHQRVEACSSEELRAVLAHNRDEEIEHAMMNLEWIRRRVPEVDLQAKKYLFTETPLTGLEDGAPREVAGGAGQGLGIGSLRHVRVPGLD